MTGVGGSCKDIICLKSRLKSVERSSGVDLAKGALVIPPGLAITSVGTQHLFNHWDKDLGQFLFQVVGGFQALGPGLEEGNEVMLNTEGGPHVGFSVATM